MCTVMILPRLSRLDATWHRVDAVAAALSREDAIAATAFSRTTRVDGVRFNFHTVQYIETGKSFCASPGTGMGTGANLNAAPADASRPTSITKSFAGWPSFFS